MFYDEAHYLGLVLPHVPWRELPKKFWWNYRKGIVTSKAPKLMISLTEKSDGEVLHTQASPCSSSLK